jgi:hypothetical protein
MPADEEFDHLRAWDERIRDAEADLRELERDLADRRARRAGTIRVQQRIDRVQGDLRAFRECRASWRRSIYGDAVKRYLEATTRHLPFQELDWLQRRSDRGGDDRAPIGIPGPRSVTHKHGVWIECGSDRRLHTLWRDRAPHAAALADLGAALGCDWVYLDADGPELPDLPTFEWS